MSPRDTFYEDSLYPLQNGVIEITRELESPFYLTGGTALSRGYFHHRYSDDLELFVNRHDNFAAAAASVVRGVGNRYRIEVVTNTADFVRLMVRSEELELRVDLVNDSSEHFGDLVTTSDLGNVDSIVNILANKLTALYRYEAKDVADILEICGNESFLWPEMIEKAAAKEAGIDPASIAEILASVPENELTQLKWTGSHRMQELRRRLSSIAADILVGKPNDPARLV